MAAMTLVRDGVEVFIRGTEAVPGTRSADMAMLERAVKEAKVHMLLANCPRLRTNLIFKLLQNAGLQILDPPAAIPGL